MARNNLVWIKGDITGDIYYDLFRLNEKEIQYLRLYLMVKGVIGASAVKGLRVCVYGPLAELAFGYVRKGSRLGVIGHIQQRVSRKGDTVFEIVADEVEFLRNIDWDAGERTRKDLVERGLMRPSYSATDNDGASPADLSQFTAAWPIAIPEDVLIDG